LVSVHGQSPQLLELFRVVNWVSLHAQSAQL
jgi:hypothetical protein